MIPNCRDMSPLCCIPVAQRYAAPFVGTKVSAYENIVVLKDQQGRKRIAPAEMLKSKWEGQSSSTFMWC